jgi:hypothetical protein
MKIIAALIGLIGINTFASECSWEFPAKRNGDTSQGSNGSVTIQDGAIQELSPVFQAYTVRYLVQSFSNQIHIAVWENSWAGAKPLSCVSQNLDSGKSSQSTCTMLNGAAFNISCSQK